jgi:hypothetical protein
MMNRQTHPKILEVGLRRVLMQSFREKPEMWLRAFHIDSTDRASFQDVAYTDFGAMQEGEELGGYSYDDAYEAVTATYVPQSYRKAFKLSEEVLEDDQNGLMRRYPRAMGRSIRHTLETTHWTHLLNGFDGAFPGPDGKPLFATDHPLYGPGGGTQANEPSAPQNLSETSLEQALIDIALTVDDREKFIQLEQDTLFVPTQLLPLADKILKTEKEVGTANNTINWVANRFPGGVVGVPFLQANPKAWYIKCDQHEMWHIWRKRVSFGQENDWDTDARKYKAKGRWVSGWTLPWGWYGSPGV